MMKLDASSLSYTMMGTQKCTNSSYGIQYSSKAYLYRNIQKGTVCYVDSWRQAWITKISELTTLLSFTCLYIYGTYNYMYGTYIYISTICDSI